MIKNITLFVFKLMFGTRTWAEFAWKVPVIFTVIFLIAVMQGTLIADLPFETAKAQAWRAMVVAFPFVLGGVTVVSHLMSLQDQLERAAFTDQLTGLGNRHAFFSDVRARLQEDERGLVLLADADHFKTVNDSYGHTAGDLCLSAIASHLIRLAPDEAHVARIGGKEFAIYLPNRAELPRPPAEWTKEIAFNPDETTEQKTITLSIGVVPTHKGAQLEDVMQHADMALYQAKASGRARMVSWSSADRQGDLLFQGDPFDAAR